MKHKMTKAQWKAAAEAYLRAHYYINLNDCTADGEPPDWWKDETPEKWCDWIGEKYGLDRFN